jgi:hypothetical protein
MEDVWQDPWISNPSARLRRILDLLEHRQSVDEQNRQLRVRFEDSQTGPDSAAGALIQASVSGDNR